MVPPNPAEFGEIARGVKNIIVGAKNGRWKQMTVREAWLNTLITVEVLCWFYIGECLGKRSLVGYQV